MKKKEGVRLPFTKMEGCGNDYIYIFDDAVNGVGGLGEKVDKKRLAIEMSDRHFGVGGDGVIWINRSAIADFEMEMYNADGSRGEMCGNGIRCVAGYVRENGLFDGDTVRIESCGKIKELYYLSKKGAPVTSVKVNMGAPVLAAAAEAPLLNDPHQNCSDMKKALLPGPIKTERSV